MADNRVAAALDEIRLRALRDPSFQVDRHDGTTLLAVLDRVLELPGKWRRFDTPNGAAAECADELEAAISAALLGEE